MAHKPQKLFKQAIHIFPEEPYPLFLQSPPPTALFIYCFPSTTPVVSQYNLDVAIPATSSSGAVSLINELLFDCDMSLFSHFILFRTEDSFLICRLDRRKSKHHIIWFKNTTKQKNFSKSTFGQSLLYCRFQVSDYNLFHLLRLHYLNLRTLFQLQRINGIGQMRRVIKNRKSEICPKLLQC